MKAIPIIAAIIGGGATIVGLALGEMPLIAAVANLFAMTIALVIAVDGKEI